ncbi:MAG: aspartate-alanine antiporter [Actinomycetota bacterium]
MFDAIESLFADVPLLPLFATVSLGYIVGQLRIGSFVLGGTAATLLVGLAIGQFDVSFSDDVKGLFFALFSYSAGYRGGPQFARSLTKKSVRHLAAAFTMCVVGLIIVLFFAYTFDLDRGTAAGLAGGGLTQTTIIGTADEAIGRLDGLSSSQIDEMQANVAAVYAITYIFGCIGPVLMVSWIIPRLMQWNVRREARVKAEKMSGGRLLLEPGEVDVATRVRTRFFRVESDSWTAGVSVDEIGERLEHAVVELVVRDGETVEPKPDLRICDGDIVAVTGFVATLSEAHPLIGIEVPAPLDVHLVEEQRDIVITEPDVVDRTYLELVEASEGRTWRSVYPTRLRRAGTDITGLRSVELNRGDELTLTGRPADLDRVTEELGYSVTRARVTDVVSFGAGMVLGVVIGLLTVNVAGAPLTLGTGGGCLVAGLAMGWLRSVHPRYAALPDGAANFLSEVGLAIFIAIVGLTSGATAIDTMTDQGAELLLMGVAVTMIPMFITFPLLYYVYKIRDPIDALATTMGGRSAQPGFAALLNDAGNATPVPTFTVTFALANLLLTLWGPLIVGVVRQNA